MYLLQNQYEHNYKLENNFKKGLLNVYWYFPNFCDLIAVFSPLWSTKSIKEGNSISFLCSYQTYFWRILTPQKKS